jgi:hypothetical protein
VALGITRPFIGKNWKNMIYFKDTLAYQRTISILSFQCKEVKSLELESMERRVEGWCDMTASLGVSQLV